MRLSCILKGFIYNFTVYNCWCFSHWEIWCFPFSSEFYVGWLQPFLLLLLVNIVCLTFSFASHNHQDPCNSRTWAPIIWKNNCAEIQVWEIPVHIKYLKNDQSPWQGAISVAEMIMQELQLVDSATSCLLNNTVLKISCSSYRSGGSSFTFGHFEMICLIDWKSTLRVLKTLENAQFKQETDFPLEYCRPCS